MRAWRTSASIVPGGSREPRRGARPARLRECPPEKPAFARQACGVDALRLGCAPQTAPASIRHALPTLAVRSQVHLPLAMIVCTRGKRLIRADAETCGPAMFNVDEEELLALNRRHYPTISCVSALLHGSPVELPRFVGGFHPRFVRGMQALKTKRTKEAAATNEKWLDVEVLAPANVHHIRWQAVLLFRCGVFARPATQRAHKISTDSRNWTHACRPNGEHLVWHAGRTMSPADFCRLAGETKRRARECIIIRQTRQTLAEYEASARARASWCKRHLTAEDFVACAEVGSPSTRWAPEIGTTVHVASCAVKDPGSQAPCVDHHHQQVQATHKTEQEQSRREAGDGAENCEAKDEPVRQQEKRPNGQEVEALAPAADDGGFQRGVLLARSIDGWYKVLLVEVIAEESLVLVRFAACHSRLISDEIVQGAGCHMTGAGVVQVRGYHIMPGHWSSHVIDFDGPIAEDWFRDLRRATLSLCVSKRGQGSRGRTSSSDDALDASRGTHLPSKAPESDDHLRRLLNQIDFGISGIEQGEASYKSVSALSTSIPAHKAPCRLPFLATLSCSMNVRALAVSASWLQEEQAEMAGVIASEHGTTRNMAPTSSDGGREDGPGVRVQTRAERGRDSPKERDGAKEDERGSKRLRTRASSGGSKGKESNEGCTGKRGTAFAPQKQQVPREAHVSTKDDFQASAHANLGPVRKKARAAGEDESHHLVQGLLHRKVAQHCLSPLCQELVEALQVQVQVQADGAIRAKDAALAEKESQGGQPTEKAGDSACRQARSATCKEGDETDETAQERAAREADKDLEEAAGRKLAEIERNEAALLRQLQSQREQIAKQVSMIRRLEAKQDLDAARASELGRSQLLPRHYSDREARDTSASLARSLEVLSCLSTYVGPAALSLRLHAAQNLCKAANDARVLVAMLISEQGQLRQRLEQLRKAAPGGGAPSPSSAAATATARGVPGAAAPTAASSNGGGGSKAPASVEASESAAVGAAAGASAGRPVAGAAGAPPVDGAAAASAAAHAEKACGAKAGDHLGKGDAEAEMAEVVAQLQRQVRLVFEMASAGATSLAACCALVLFSRGGGRWD